MSDFHLQVTNSHVTQGQSWKTGLSRASFKILTIKWSKSQTSSHTYNGCTLYLSRCATQCSQNRSNFSLYLKHKHQAVVEGRIKRRKTPPKKHKLRLSQSRLKLKRRWRLQLMPCDQQPSQNLRTRENGQPRLQMRRWSMPCHRRRTKSTIRSWLMRLLLINLSRSTDTCSSSLISESVSKVARLSHSRWLPSLTNSSLRSLARL